MTQSEEIAERMKGRRIGRLLLGDYRRIERPVGSDGLTRHVVYVTCRCDCGRVAEIRLDALRKALTKSCGCLRKGVVI